MTVMLPALTAPVAAGGGQPKCLLKAVVIARALPFRVVMAISAISVSSTSRAPDIRLRPGQALLLR